MDSLFLLLPCGARFGSFGDWGLVYIRSALLEVLPAKTHRACPPAGWLLAFSLHHLCIFVHFLPHPEKLWKKVWVHLYSFWGLPCASKEATLLLLLASALLVEAEQASANGRGEGRENMGGGGHHLSTTWTGSEWICTSDSGEHHLTWSLCGCKSIDTPQACNFSLYAAHIVVIIAATQVTSAKLKGV